MGQDLHLLVVMNLILWLLVCATVAYVAHKCRRVYLKQFEAERLAGQRTDNLYTQIEALLALEKDLALPRSLPPTRGWAGSADFLLHVHRIATRLCPESIVECSSGTSTVVLARTAQLNGRGHVYSLEHEPVYAQKTRVELDRQDLQQYATVIDAPLRAFTLDGRECQWYETTGLPLTIDLLVIDGPPMTTQPQARYPAVPVLNDRISPGGRVILDDANRPDERAALERWKAEFQFTAEEELFAEKGIALLKRRIT